MPATETKARAPTLAKAMQPNSNMMDPRLRMWRLTAEGSAPVAVLMGPWLPVQRKTMAAKPATVKETVP